jgi:hypothetical protein
MCHEVIFLQAALLALYDILDDIALNDYISGVIQ